MLAPLMLKRLEEMAKMSGQSSTCRQGGVSLYWGQSKKVVTGNCRVSFGWTKVMLVPVQEGRRRVVTGCVGGWELQLWDLWTMCCL